MRLPRSARIAAPRKQRGAVLIISLMFLVLLTIIGVSGISSTTVEERMAANSRDHETAFQAAESALRDAEIDLEPAIGGTNNRDAAVWALGAAALAAAPVNVSCAGAFTGGVCTNGPSSPPGNAYKTQIVTAPAWNWGTADVVNANTVIYGTYTGARPIPSTMVSRQPRYVIEYLPEKDFLDTLVTPNVTYRYFRITARGWGANVNTSVTLQSVYRLALN